MAQIAYKIEIRKPAIKVASELLRKIYCNDDDVDAKECMELIISAETDEDADFFLSALDEVINFCNELKQDIIDESKQGLIGKETYKTGSWSEIKEE